MVFGCTAMTMTCVLSCFQVQQLAAEEGGKTRPQSIHSITGARWAHSTKSARLASHTIPTAIIESLPSAVINPRAEILFLLAQVGLAIMAKLRRGEGQAHAGSVH